MLILSLFLLASRIGRSTQVGAATVLLYAASAQFYFFNSQFTYQTVAIAMLVGRALPAGARPSTPRRSGPGRS